MICMEYWSNIPWIISEWVERLNDKDAQVMF